jgi:hypothetical protein
LRPIGLESTRDALPTPAGDGYGFEGRDGYFDALLDALDRDATGPA